MANYTLQTYAAANGYTYDASDATILLRAAVSDVSVDTLTINENIYIGGADGTKSGAVTVTINNPNLVLTGTAWIQPLPSSVLNQWHQPWHINIVAMKEFRNLTFSKLVPMISSNCNAGAMLWDGLTFLYNGIRFYPDDMVNGVGYKHLGNYQGTLFRNITFCTDGHKFSELNCAFQGFIDTVTIRGCKYLCPSSAATPSPSPYDAILPAGWPPKAPMLDAYSNVFVPYTLDIQDWRCFWAGGGNNVVIEDCEFHLWGMYGMIKMYQTASQLSQLAGVSGSYENITVRRNKFYELGQQECISYDAFDNVIAFKGTVQSVDGNSITFTNVAAAPNSEITKLTCLTYMGKTGGSAGHYYKILGPDSLSSTTMTLSAYREDLDAIKVGDTFVAMKVAVNWYIYDNDFYHTEACRCYGTFIGTPVAAQASGSSAGWQVFNNRYHDVRVPFNDYTYSDSAGSASGITMGNLFENNWMTGYRQFGWQVLLGGRYNQYDSADVGVRNIGGICRNNIGENWVYTAISEVIAGPGVNGPFGEYPTPAGASVPITFGYGLADVTNFTDQGNVIDTRPDISGIPTGYRNIKNHFDNLGRNTYRDQVADPAPVLLHIDSDVYYATAGSCSIYGYCTVGASISVSSDGGAIVSSVVFNAAHNVFAFTVTGVTLNQNITITCSAANAKPLSKTALLSTTTASAETLSVPTNAPDISAIPGTGTGSVSSVSAQTSVANIIGIAANPAICTGVYVDTSVGQITGAGVVNTTAHQIRAPNGSFFEIRDLSGNVYILRSL